MCCLRQQPEVLLHTFLFIQPNSFYITSMLREAVLTRIKKFSLIILVHNLHTMCIAALSIMPALLPCHRNHVSFVTNLASFRFGIGVLRVLHPYTLLSRPFWCIWTAMPDVDESECPQR